MSQPGSREIRLFLSSTFQDMHAERDYLLARVFPGFRESCELRDVTFTEVDLRWGVTEEASAVGRTVEICLEQIDRCRVHPPFFLGLLGERYGWIPTETDLAAYLRTERDSVYVDRIRSALAQGMGVTDLECRHGFLDGGHSQFARVFLRSRELTDSLYEQSRPGTPPETFYDPADGRLAKLKSMLVNSGCVGINGYSSIEEMGEAVRQYLHAGLDALFPASLGDSAAARRRSRQRAFAVSRRRGHVPRDDLRDQARDIVASAFPKGDAHWQFHGDSGCGKSSLMADLEQWLPGATGWRLLSYYVGADGDRSFAGLATYIAEELLELGVAHPEQAPSASAQERLATHLAQAVAATGSRFVLLVDAVDQFAAPTDLAMLEALPIPPGVGLIASGIKPIDAPGWRSVPVLPFDSGLRRSAIRSFFGLYGKELPRTAVEVIVDRDCTANPLFLRLLLEELRLHARFETLQQVTQTLVAAGTTRRLFDEVVAQIDREFDSAGLASAGSRSADLIAASWRGLSDRELAVLLAGPQHPLDPAIGTHRVPDALHVQLISRLEAFCLRDCGRLRLMHGSLLPLDDDAPDLIKARLDLLEYFCGDSPREIGERLYQRTRLGSLSIALTELLDLETTLAVQREDPGLLREILVAVVDETMHGRASGQLARHWSEATSSRPDAQALAWCRWLHDEGFHALAKSVSEGALQGPTPMEPALRIEWLLLEVSAGQHAGLQALTLERCNETLSLAEREMRGPELESLRVRAAGLLASEYPDRAREVLSVTQGSPGVAAAWAKLECGARRWEAALAQCTQAVAELRPLLPSAEIELARMLIVAGEAAFEARRPPEECRAPLEEAVRRLHRRLGSDSIETVLARFSLGRVFLAAQQYEKAYDVLRLAQPVMRRWRADSPMDVRINEGLATALVGLGRASDALPLLERCLAAFKLPLHSIGAQERVAICLSRAHEALGDIATAEHFMSQAQRVAGHWFDSPPDVRSLYADESSEAKRLRLIALRRELGLPVSAVLLEQAREYASPSNQKRQLARAFELGQDALKELRRARAPDSTLMLACLSELARWASDMGDSRLAQELLEQQYSVYAAVPGRTDLELAFNGLLRGDLFAERGDAPSAQSVYSEALRVFSARRVAHGRAAAHVRLARLNATGNREAAIGHLGAAATALRGFMPPAGRDHISAQALEVCRQLDGHFAEEFTDNELRGTCLWLRVRFPGACSQDGQFTTSQCTRWVLETSAASLTFAALPLGVPVSRLAGIAATMVLHTESICSRPDGQP